MGTLTPYVIALVCSQNPAYDKGLRQLEQGRVTDVIDLVNENLNSETDPTEQSRWLVLKGLAFDVLDEPQDCFLNFFEALSLDMTTELPLTTSSGAEQLFACAQDLASQGVTTRELRETLAQDGLERNAESWLCPEIGRAAPPAPPPAVVPPPAAGTTGATSKATAEVEPDTKPVTWPFWTATTIAVAGIATGVATGVMSQSKADEANDGSLRPPSERDDLISEAESLNDVSTIGYIVGGSAAGLALVLWLAPMFGKHGRPLFVAAPNPVGPGIQLSGHF